MPNIQKVEVKSTSIEGLRVRTTNANEMNVETQKIAPLWQEFYEKILPTLKEGAKVYAVYHNYESDARGEFDILVGTDILEIKDKINSVTLEGGQYLMFSAKGELPQAIIDTWQKIWAYFEDESIDERRAYETDFELYKSASEVEIYIGVHYF